MQEIKTRASKTKQRYQFSSKPLFKAKITRKDLVTPSDGRRPGTIHLTAPWGFTARRRRGVHPGAAAGSCWHPEPSTEAQVPHTLPHGRLQRTSQGKKSHPDEMEESKPQCCYRTSPSSAAPLEEPHRLLHTRGLSPPANTPTPASALQRPHCRSLKRNFLQTATRKHLVSSPKL